MKERYVVGIKRLSAVEASRKSSNQHELNGTAALKSVLGTERLTAVPVNWVDLRDDEASEGAQFSLTWYDAREDDDRRPAEWRLYYRGEPAISPGDVLVLLRRESDRALAVVTAPSGSTWAAQLGALFGDPDAKGGSFVQTSLESVPTEYLVVANELFEAIGWAEQPIPPAKSDLDVILSRFGERFPTTAEFSALARELEGTDLSDPDSTLYAWWRREEAMFAALEDRELAARLSRQPPFASVADFLAFSLSVQNRRKSRAGHALENHVAALLSALGLGFTRNATTEGQRRPDFVLPSESDYQNPNFPEDLLTVLGAKTTCKDRWRQVIDEAQRAKQKYLITLEAAISTDQLEQMKEANVQLVVIRQLLPTYKPPAGYRILTVSEFVAEALEKQRRVQT